MLPEFLGTADQVISGNGATPVATDMTTTVTVDNTRDYHLWLESQFLVLTSGTNWNFNAYEGSTQFARWRLFRSKIASDQDTVCGAVLYKPATSGSFALNLKMVGPAAASNFTLQANSGAGLPRRLYLVDIGPRT